MAYNEGRMVAYPAHCRNNGPMKHETWNIVGAIPKA